mgnify:CR=1 FL=1
MKRKYLINIFLFIFVLGFIGSNFCFAKSLYLENLKFKSLYSFSRLIFNPVQKISYLNSLLEYTFDVYKKNSNNNLALNNYLTILKDLEKEWSKFSFKYSSYPSLYDRSLDLYFKQLVNASNDKIEKNLLNIIVRVIYNIDTKQGLESLNRIGSRYNTNLEKLKISEQIDLSKSLDYKDLINILKELQKLVKEFENGERVITGNYQEFAKKLVEIQQEAKSAQQNIKDLNIEGYKKNIKKLKENLDFIKNNSKKIK